MASRELDAPALRLVLEQRSLMLVCVPGVIFVLMGLALAGHLIYLFDVGNYFGIPVALLTLGSVLTGMVLIIFGAMMYALSRILGRSWPLSWRNAGCRIHRTIR